MKITSVRYRRLQSSRYDYGHTAVEAEADVGFGDAPEDVLAELRLFVDGKLNDQAEAEKLNRTRDSIANEIGHLTRRRDDLIDDVRRGRAVVLEHRTLADLADAHGLDAEAQSLRGDEVPF